MAPITYILPSLNFSVTSNVAAQIDAYNPTLPTPPYINLYMDMSASVLNHLFAYVDVENSTNLSDISTIKYGVVPVSSTLTPNSDGNFNNIFSSLANAIVHSKLNLSNAVDASYGSIYVAQNGTKTYPEDYLSYTYVYSMSNSDDGVAVNGGVNIVPTNEPLGIFNVVSFKSELGSNSNDSLASKLRDFSSAGFTTYATESTGNANGNSLTALPSSSIIRQIYQSEPTRFNSTSLITQADLTGNVSISLGTGSYTHNIGAGNSLYNNFIVAQDVLTFILTVNANPLQKYKSASTAESEIPTRYYRINITAN